MSRWAMLPLGGALLLLVSACAGGAVSAGNAGSSARGLGDDGPTACERVLSAISDLGMRQARTGVEVNRANSEMAFLQSRLNDIRAAMAAPAPSGPDEATMVRPSIGLAERLGSPKPLPSDLRGYLLGTASPTPAPTPSRTNDPSLQEQYDATIVKIRELNARQGELQDLINEQSLEAGTLETQWRQECAAESPRSAP